ncbi:gypsy-like retrotransposase [Cucumis melo var. makuwa]|uniref:Gypsy-like retrotransposase n=1 Tax=Cucumis melo var. makuwa TaxID=1194695 RepID=A0A5D3DFU7_CUCMM|nr:gypsy-like retrotransposase [Cucumis melo var. makuwa]
MELSIASRGAKDFLVPKVRKDKKETKGAEKIMKSTVKESMLVNTTTLKFFKRKEVISHPVVKCFVSKELILRLAHEKKIELDFGEFKTFEPIVVQFYQEVAPEDSQGKERSIEEDDEGWIVVIHQKKRNIKSSVPGKPLILYIAAQKRSLGTLLVNKEEKEKERALYYISRILVGVEVNYSPIEKMCLSLFFAIDKLRHYMQAFTIHLVAKADPIKSGAGAGIILIYAEKHMLPYSFALADCARPMWLNIKPR